MPIFSATILYYDASLIKSLLRNVEIITMSLIKFLYMFSQQWNFHIRREFLFLSTDI